MEWCYDDGDDTFSLDLKSSDYENTSCSCHPEYRLTTHYSSHVIPASEIMSPPIDPEIDQWADEAVFKPYELPSYLAAKAALDAKKAAEEQARLKIEAERRTREELLQKARDEREFERLREKRGRA